MFRGINRGMPPYSAVAHATLVLLALARGATAITMRVGFMGKSKSPNDGQQGHDQFFAL